MNLPSVISFWILNHVVLLVHVFFVHVPVKKYLLGLFIFETALYYQIEYRIILKFKLLNLVDYFFC